MKNTIDFIIKLFALVGFIFLAWVLYLNIPVWFSNDEVQKGFTRLDGKECIEDVLSRAKSPFSKQEAQHLKVVCRDDSIEYHLRITNVNSQGLPQRSNLIFRKHKTKEKFTPLEPFKFTWQSKESLLVQHGKGLYFNGDKLNGVIIEGQVN